MVEAKAEEVRGVRRGVQRQGAQREILPEVQGGEGKEMMDRLQRLLGKLIGWGALVLMALLLALGIAWCAIELARLVMGL